MKDYYYLLGLKQTATSDEIKDSYRRLAKKFHPDLNGGDAFFADRFKDINEAHDVLSDSNKRKSYNLSLGISASNDITPQSAPQNTKKSNVDIELKQESLNFLADEHPRYFEFRLRDNFGNNVAAEYYIEPKNGKIVVDISYEYANNNTIIKICGITALLSVTNVAMSSKIKETYNLLYKQQFNNEDLGWNNDVDFINNHIEGIILNDFCKFAIVDGKIYPRSDSLSEISLFSKAFKTSMKGFFVSSFERNEVPKWLYYIFTGCKSESNLRQDYYTKKQFFGRCKVIKIKSDIL